MKNPSKKTQIRTTWRAKNLIQIDAPGIDMSWCPGELISERYREGPTGLQITLGHGLSGFIPYTDLEKVKVVTETITNVTIEPV